MPAQSLVQTHVDADVTARASAILEATGLTVSDAVQILLTRTAQDGALPFELDANPAAYDAWYRARMRETAGDLV